MAGIPEPPGGDTPEARLAALGVELPTPPAPAAAYTPTARTGDALYVSGQVPMERGSLVTTGKLGAEVPLEAGQRCARACAVNVLAQLKAALGDLTRVRRVVKLTVFVASEPGFAEQHLVANGASEFLGEVFGEAGQHARSAVGVASLPLNAPVEVEAIVEVAP
jgi:enamine deaminase RidA (YjgF/YER057c/UK114 family)